MRSTIYGFLATGLLLGSVQAQDSKEFKDQRDRTSYAFGQSIATSWKRQELGVMDLNYDMVLRAIQDTMTGKTNLLSEKERSELMAAFQNEHRTKAEEKRKREGEQNKKAGEAFLAENKKKPGVITLPSGLQYKVLQEGTGGSPRATDRVTVNYRGTLIDGTEFDSSYSRNAPATFGVNGVIKGWTEALQLMKAGSKWQLFVPSELAYGERGNARIGANSVLIFEVELISFETPAPPAPPQPVTSDIIKVPSAEELKKGAQIEIIKPDQVEKLQKEEAAKKK